MKTLLRQTTLLFVAMLVCVVGMIGAAHAVNLPPEYVGRWGVLCSDADCDLCNSSFPTADAECRAEHRTNKRHIARGDIWYERDSATKERVEAIKSIERQPDGSDIVIYSAPCPGCGQERDPLTWRERWLLKHDRGRTLWWVLTLDKQGATWGVLCKMEPTSGPIHEVGYGGREYDINWHPKCLGDK
jgi:hypothetical protein